MKKLLAILFVTMLAGGAAVLACGDKAAVTDCPMTAKSIDRTVEAMDNGVRITLASNDAEMVKKIQAKGGECGECSKSGDCALMRDAVTRTVEKTDTGIMILATSSDAETVKTLKAHAASEGGCKFKKGKKGAAEKTSNEDGGCDKNKKKADTVAASR